MNPVLKYFAARSGWFWALIFTCTCLFPDLPALAGILIAVVATAIISRTLLRDSKLAAEQWWQRRFPRESPPDDHTSSQ
jgi:hypothetical protein